MIKHLESGEKLEDVLGSELTLVDFYADWCGPCKMLAPILEQLDLPIIKVNVDVHDALAREYGIMSIPTLIFFKEKKEIKKEIGLRSKEELEKIISEL